MALSKINFTYTASALVLVFTMAGCSSVGSPPPRMTAEEQAKLHKAKTDFYKAETTNALARQRLALLEAALEGSTPEQREVFAKELFTLLQHRNPDIQKGARGSLADLVRRDVQASIHQILTAETRGEKQEARGELAKIHEGRKYSQLPDKERRAIVVEKLNDNDLTIQEVKEDFERGEPRCKAVPPSPGSTAFIKLICEKPSLP